MRASAALSVLTALVCTALVGAGPAWADPEAEVPRLSISISGGASLGSFEAGSLYYLVEALRDGRVARPEAFVGTSAGAINALIAALEMCGAPAARPEDSLFYQTWIPIDFEALFVPEDVTAVSGLSRQALAAAAAQIEQRFNQGLPPECDVLLGMTATRLQPVLQGRANGRLRLPRMAARFLFRVQGQGSGRPPLVDNHQEGSQLGLTRLALDDQPEKAFEQLTHLALASAAFPVGFAPQRVATCPPGRSPSRCTSKSASEALFIDGGIFDQNPIQLGVEALWSRGEARETDIHFLLDPFSRDFPRASSVETDGLPESLVDYVADFVGGFIETARFGALESLLRQHPELEERLVVSATRFAPYGELGLYFLAFFESGFRHFDFALGMLEARDALRASEAPVDPRVDAPTLTCVSAVLEPGPGIPTVEAACPNESDRLIPLARVSLERVYDACRLERFSGRVLEAVPSSSNEGCRKALAGGNPPGTTDDGWRRQDNETEVAWVFRRLEHHGYRFRDLGTDGSARSAYAELREAVGQLARRMAHAQPSLTPFYAAAAKNLADRIEYRPPTHVVHLALGPTLELGYSGALDVWPWLRLDSVLAVQGVATLLSPSDPFFGLAPMAGLSLEPPFLSGSGVQFRLGLRGGYLFGTQDSFLTGTCAERDEGLRPCSRPVVQAHATVLFLDLLRVGLVGQWLVPVRNGERSDLSLQPLLGVQLILH